MPLKTSLKEEFQAVAPGRVRFDEPMRLHTTFRIGGPAEIWVQPASVEELRELVALAREGDLPVTLVGGGANLLVRDEGIPGLVVNLSDRGFQEVEARGEEIAAGAALPLERLVRRAQELGLRGVEFLAGVPGRVGGAVRMNAGTHDDEGKIHSFSDVIRSVTVMDFEGQVKVLRREEIPFAYRHSGLSDSIVLEAALALAPGDPAAIARRVQRLWDFKKRTQDWSAPSVGCIFKNPPGKSAGQLVDQAGFKGRRIGGARVSPVHANFILNVSDARAADVLALVEEIRAGVRRKFEVELETEVQILPHG